MAAQGFSSPDLIVVGSGIAGLYAALCAAPHGKIVLVTKSNLEESNTRYAQGGIAAALGPNDFPQLHLRDTISAGDGLCDRDQVTILTNEAPECIVNLLRLGVSFDREGGELAWTREAAHSLPRILHAGGDATGAALETTLARAVRVAGVRIVENAFLTSLIVNAADESTAFRDPPPAAQHEDAGPSNLPARPGRVCGVRLRLQDSTVAQIEAPYVILASGGAGQLFSRTTNPPVATGDGLAVAYRAGAELTDMEFMQFHPTAFSAKGAPSFLVSEAMRGEGAVLRNLRGDAFMSKYHPDAELAPRDVVARAIHQEMAREGDDHALLDATAIPSGRLGERFPSIIRFCKEWHLDPVREAIPVSPAAHYLMGGIRTDSYGRTNISGLLAVGEVACTGVHGANRLASNSLLEGLVFARRAVQAVVQDDGLARASTLSIHGIENPEASRPAVIRKPLSLKIIDQPSRNRVSRGDLGETMWQNAGLIRSEESLRRVLSLVGSHESELPYAIAPSSNAAGASSLEETDQVTWETSNMVLLSGVMARSALIREESRGSHFRSDFPNARTSWKRHVVISRQGVWLTPADPLAGRPMAMVDVTHG